VARIVAVVNPDALSVAGQELKGVCRLPSSALFDFALDFDPAVGRVQRFSRGA